MIDLVQRSTIHGVNHIYSAKNKIFKILWLILFLFGIGGILFNVILIFMKYFSYPQILSYTLDNDVFKWPKLTFCNPNAPVYLEKSSSSMEYWKNISQQTREIIEMLANETRVFRIIHNKDISDYELEQMSVTLATANPRKLEIHEYDKPFLFVGYVMINLGISYVSEYYKENYVSNEQMLKLFSGDTVQIRNNIPCQTFNFKPLDKSVPYSIQSLVFGIRFNQDNYLFYNSSYTFRSILLYIYNEGETPTKPIELTPGYVTSIKLSQTLTKSLSYKKPCRLENFTIELYDPLLENTKFYDGNNDDCKKIYSQQMFVNQCNCYSPFLPIYRNNTGYPRICLNATIFSKVEILNNAKCMVEVYEKYENNEELKRIFDLKCRKYKIKKCASYKYNINLRKESIIESWSNFSNDRRNESYKIMYESIIGKRSFNNEHLEKMRDNYIELKIIRDLRYSDLYLEIWEYPFSKLLSDIGGLLGFWLGISIVGLFELVEYFYWFVKNKCSCQQVTQNEENEIENTI